MEEAPNGGILVRGFPLYAAGEAIELGLAWEMERVVWVQVADLPGSALPDRAEFLDRDHGLRGRDRAVDTCGLLKRRLDDLGYDGPSMAQPLAGCRSLECNGTRDRAQATVDAV